MQVLSSNKELMETTRASERESRALRNELATDRANRAEMEKNLAAALDKIDTLEEELRKRPAAPTEEAPPSKRMAVTSSHSGGGAAAAAVPDTMVESAQVKTAVQAASQLSSSALSTATTHIEATNTAKMSVRATSTAKTSIPTLKLGAKKGKNNDGGRGKKIQATDVLMDHFKSKHFQGESNVRARTLVAFPEPQWIRALAPKGSKHEHLMKLLAISFDSDQWEEVVSLQDQMKDLDAEVDAEARAKAAKANADTTVTVQRIFNTIAKQAHDKMMVLENSLNMHEGKTNPGSRSTLTLMGLGGRFSTFISMKGAHAKYEYQLEQTSANKQCQSVISAFFQSVGNVLSPSKKKKPTASKVVNPYAKK